MFSGTLNSEVPANGSHPDNFRNHQVGCKVFVPTFRRCGCSRLREANTAHRSIWRRLRHVAMEAGTASDAGHPLEFIDENGGGRGLELLKGKRAGQMSIRINDQWRICFRWLEKDAEDVEIMD